MRGNKLKKKNDSVVFSTNRATFAKLTRKYLFLCQEQHFTKIQIGNSIFTVIFGGLVSCHIKMAQRSKKDRNTKDPVVNVILFNYVST